MRAWVSCRAGASLPREINLSSLSRSVALRLPLFACGFDPSHGAAHGRTAHRNPAYGLYTVAALSEGDERALLEVLFEELTEPLIHLGVFAGCLARLQGLSPLGLGSVTLDGRNPDPEGASRLSLGHTSPDEVHDLLTEVFRVRFHRFMLTYGLSSPQHAVSGVLGDL
jgi:hypothetical protein